MVNRAITDVEIFHWWKIPISKRDKGDERRKQKIEGIKRWNVGKNNSLEPYSQENNVAPWIIFKNNSRYPEVAEKLKKHGTLSTILNAKPQIWRIQKALQSVYHWWWLRKQISYGKIVYRKVYGITWKITLAENINSWR